MTYFVSLVAWLSSKSAPFTEGYLPLGCQMIAEAPELIHTHLQTQREQQASLPQILNQVSVHL